MDKDLALTVGGGLALVVFALVALLLVLGVVAVPGSFTSNTLGERCKDCVDVHISDYDSTPTSNKYENSYSYGGNLDCLGDLPNYRVVRENTYFRPDGMSCAEAHPGEDCYEIYIGSIAGPHNQLYAGTGNPRSSSLIAYKPIQHPECASELQSLVERSGHNITTPNTVYVCEDGEKTLNASVCEVTSSADVVSEQGEWKIVTESWWEALTDWLKEFWTGETQ